MISKICFDPVKSTVAKICKLPLENRFLHEIQLKFVMIPP